MQNFNLGHTVHSESLGVKSMLDPVQNESICLLRNTQIPEKIQAGHTLETTRRKIDGGHAFFRNMAAFKRSNHSRRNYASSEACTLSILFSFFVWEY